MINQRKKHLQKLAVIVIVFILIFAVVILFNITKKQKKSGTVEQKNIQLNNLNYITPTILPALDTDKTIFKHPQNNFSFEYPSNWQINIAKQTVLEEDWYSIMLTDQSNNNAFKIDFMNGGRGGPYYEYETNEEKIINGRKINWKTMYKDDKAFEAVVSFPNNDFGHDLIGLYIYLPKENQEQFIKEVEDIIASLK